MIKFYFTSEKPFVEKPKETEHLFQEFECPYEYAFTTIDDLLGNKFKTSFELHPIYEIDIQEPKFHVTRFHHKKYKVTNAGGDVYHEIDYHKSIPHDHLYAIAKGINQTHFEININNKELLYALICRGHEKDLEKIINAWQKREPNIYQNSHIATLFVTHQADKYGDFFLSETKHLAHSNVLAAYGKYGTTEQQDYLLKYRSHIEAPFEIKLPNRALMIINKYIYDNPKITSIIKQLMEKHQTQLGTFINQPFIEKLFELLLHSQKFKNHCKKSHFSDNYVYDKTTNREYPCQFGFHSEVIFKIVNSHKEFKAMKEKDDFILNQLEIVGSTFTDNYKATEQYDDSYKENQAQYVDVHQSIIQFYQKVKAQAELLKKLKPAKCFELAYLEDDEVVTERFVNVPSFIKRLKELGLKEPQDDNTNLDDYQKCQEEEAHKQIDNILYIEQVDDIFRYPTEFSVLKSNK